MTINSENHGSTIVLYIIVLSCTIISSNSFPIGGSPNLPGIRVVAATMQLGHDLTATTIQKGTKRKDEASARLRMLRGEYICVCVHVCIYVM